MPPFDGIGANEYIVDVAHDAVDFISTVDTPPLWELNIWYHTLNGGFRTRISGETDFPVHLRRPRRPRPQLRAARRSCRLRRLGGGHPRRPRVRDRRQEPPDRLPHRRSQCRRGRQRAAAATARHRARARARRRAARRDARMRRSAAVAATRNRTGISSARASATGARCRSSSSSTARPWPTSVSSPTARCRT